jgi:transcriptional regulator with XRE-family HTH domain
MTQKKYIKKVIPNSPQSSSDCRSARLRKLRNMANLSRDAMCNSEGLNINTYKGWEIARYGGLPIDGAEKAIARVAKERVICTLEWLLHGTGIGPYVIPEYQEPNTPIDSSDDNLSNQEKQNILNEIQVFKKNHASAVAYQVEDDGLLSYKPGDLIAGIPYYQEKMIKAIDQDCIIQTVTGLILARRLRAGETAGKYNLVCTNPGTSAKKPVAYDVTLISAAPIIRHYRRHAQ